MSDNASRRKLDHRRPPGEAVDLYLEVTAQQMTISATITQQTQTFCYQITSFPATSQPLDSRILRQTFAAVANEPFTLNQLTCSDLPAIVIPPAQLKQIRRDLYRELRLAQQEKTQQQRQQHREAALGSLLGPGTGEQRQRRVRVQLNDAREQHLLQNELIDSLLLPINRGNLQHADKLRRRAENIIWDLPFVLFEQDWQDHKAAIRSLVQAGFKNFRLANLGHFPLFDGLSKLTLYSSYRLQALNSQTFSALAEIGIKDVELYIEDDRHNLFAILSRNLPAPASLTLFGRVPLLASRIRVRQVRGDSPVLSDQDEAYRLQQRQGLTWLYSETPFSFIANMDELQHQGCTGFVLDLSHCGATSAQGKQVLEAVSRGTDPAHCSKFNFDSGLE